jgi:glycosyltransferase involved in cell wall biosynthesis
VHSLGQHKASDQNEVDQTAAMVRVVCHDVSLRRMDGGGQRVDAFLRALKNEGSALDVVGVGPEGIDGAENAISAVLHRVKRRLFPVPFRGRVEAELALLKDYSPTLSLIPSANRWALRSNRKWLDFPDLSSNIARNHARTVDRVSGAFNMAQARLWSKREVSEYDQADVVSVASWSDSLQMGNKAMWLPTPVAESGELVRRRSAPSAPQAGVVYGMIANFDYPPNRDAYGRLIREWLPLLLPNASRIVVAGFGSKSLRRAMNVDILGPVENIATFYDLVDVVVAPIERGGGMKVKVVEAMMHGRPVVATEHAMDGLPQAIAEECIKWGRLSSGSRDPRENPAVVNALENFTFESFQTKFSSLWRQRMVARD